MSHTETCILGYLIIHVQEDENNEEKGSNDAKPYWEIVISEASCLHFDNYVRDEACSTRGAKKSLIILVVHHLDRIIYGKICLSRVDKIVGISGAQA